MRVQKEKERMADEMQKIILVESDNRLANLITGMLSLYQGTTVAHARTLQDGMDLVQKNGCDIILANVQLPDAGGNEVAEKLSHIPTSPVIILFSEKIAATHAMPLLKYGAQDFLYLPTTSSEDLQLSIATAQERQAFNAELYKQVVVDELTQLYNKRGFERLAQRQLDLAHRTKRRCCLVFVDLDNLKAINDTLGHVVGNRAIVEVATTLKQTLRSTDIVGRIGGDEFVVLAPDIDMDRIDALITRFKKELDRLNEDTRRIYLLSASIGIVEYDPATKISLENLQDLACKKMYSDKATKPHTRRPPPPMLTRNK